jgi:hypothetical protein
MHTAIHRKCGQRRRAGATRCAETVVWRGFPGTRAFSVVSRKPIDGALRVEWIPRNFVHEQTEMNAAPPHASDEAIALATATTNDKRGAKTARENVGANFLRTIIAEDNRSGKYGGRVVTRFPPEPNGYLHFGHAKSIVLNFGLAAENGGVCHLRFDDTNPLKEDVEYEDSIAEAVRWLGYDWGPHRYHASDYYDHLYRFAEWFIEHGLRRQPVGRRDAGNTRDADRAGHQQSVPRSQHR